MTDTVVIFTHAPWPDFPYKSIIRALSVGRTVYIVSGDVVRADQDERILGTAESPAAARFEGQHNLNEPAPPADPLETPLQPLTLGELTCSAIQWEKTIAVVTHPHWVDEAAGRSPAVLAVLLPHGLEPGDDAYLRCRDRLCGLADIVVTRSETFYFDQSLRRCGVFIMDGLEATADEIASIAVSKAANGHELKGLVGQQRQRRAEVYAGKMAREPVDAGRLFFQSVYYYLLGDGGKAEAFTIAAFEQAVFAGLDQALNTYYRFLSAIRLLQGRLQDAIATFGISAVTDEERALYDKLCRWQSEGQDKLAEAMLYRMNDDFKRSALVLENCVNEGKLPADGDGIPESPPPGSRTGNAEASGRYVYAER